MSEVTRQDMIGLMYQFASNNREYRDAMLADPKALLAKQLQKALPENLTVKVVQETPNTFYLVAPLVSDAGDELSDDDLEMVSGGESERGDSTENQNRYTCNDTKGIGTRVEVELNL